MYTGLRRYVGLDGFNSFFRFLTSNDVNDLHDKYNTKVTREPV